MTSGSVDAMRLAFELGSMAINRGNFYREVEQLDVSAEVLQRGISELKSYASETPGVEQEDEYATINAMLHNSLATVLAQLGDTRLSEIVAREAITHMSVLSKKSAQNQILLARCYRTLSMVQLSSDFEKGLQAARKAGEIHDALLNDGVKDVNLVADAATIHESIAVACIRAKEYEQALDHFEIALNQLDLLKQYDFTARQRRLHSSVLFGRALCWSEMGEFERAIADLELSLQLEPDSRTTAMRRLLIATCRAGTRDYRAALEEMAEWNLDDTLSDGLKSYNWAVGFSLASHSASIDDRYSPSERAEIAEQYASKAVAYVKEAQARGYFSETHVPADRDPLLKNLRGRADFAELLQLREVLWSLKVGQRLRYHIVMDQEVQGLDEAGERPIHTRATYDLVWNVVDLDADGVAVIDVSIDRIRSCRLELGKVVDEFDSAGHQRLRGIDGEAVNNSLTALAGKSVRMTMNAQGVSPNSNGRSSPRMCRCSLRTLPCLPVCSFAILSYPNCRSVQAKLGRLTSLTPMRISAPLQTPAVLWKLSSNVMKVSSQRLVLLYHLLKAPLRVMLMFSRSSSLRESVTSRSICGLEF